MYQTIILEVVALHTQSPETLVKLNVFCFIRHSKIKTNKLAPLGQVVAAEMLTAMSDSDSTLFML